MLVTTSAGRLLETIGSGESGQVDGTFPAARMVEPQGLALDEAGGRLYVADARGQRILLVDLKTKTVSTLAGTGELGSGAIGPEAKPARSVALRTPWDLALRGETLYVALAGSHQLGVIDLGAGPSAGTLRRFAGTGREALHDGPPDESAYAQPSGLSLQGETLYVADSEASAIRAVDLRDGSAKTLLGTGLFDCGDLAGPLRPKMLQHPVAVAASPAGLWIADTYNRKIKRLVATAPGKAFDALKTVVTSAAGAYLGNPSGLAVEPDGSLLIADTDRHRILRLPPGASEPLVLVVTQREAVASVVSASSTAPATHTRGEELTLAPQRLRPGPQKLAFQLLAPKGYAFSEGAPWSLDLMTEGEGVRVVEPRREGQAVGGNQVLFDASIEASGGSSTLLASVRATVCDDVNHAACYPRRLRYRVPVTVSGEVQRLERPARSVHHSRRPAGTRKVHVDEQHEDQQEQPACLEIQTAGVVPVHQHPDVLGLKTRRGRRHEVALHEGDDHRLVLGRELRVHPQLAGGDHGLADLRIASPLDQQRRSVQRPDLALVEPTLIAGAVAVDVAGDLRVDAVRGTGEIVMSRAAELDGDGRGKRVDDVLLRLRQEIGTEPHPDERDQRTGLPATPNPRGLLELEPIVGRIGHAGTRSATAETAIPSCRPTKPSRSPVVALMLIREPSIPSTCASRAVIAEALGAILGLRAATVRSTFPTRKPASLIKATTRPRSPRLSRSAEGLIRVRKMATDVAHPGRAEDRVGHGVRHDVRIAVTGKTVPLEFDPRQDQPPPLGEGMDVVAKPHPRAIHRSPSLNPEQLVRTSEVLRRGDLHVRGLPLHHCNRKVQRLEKPSLVGTARGLGPEGSKGIEELASPEGLRCLHEGELPCDRRSGRPRPEVTRLTVSLIGTTGMAAPCSRAASRTRAKSSALASGRTPS